MLKHRVLTALVLIPIVLGAILCPDPRVFALLMLVVVAVAANEWARLNTLNTYFSVAYSLLAVVLAGLLYYYEGTVAYVLLAGLLSVFWIYASIAVVAYQKQVSIQPTSRPLLLLVGLLMLVGTWSSLFYIKIGFADGSQLLVFLLVLIWCADSGAYFAGRRWGSRRLASRVSPGKTWEGTAAGMLSGLCVGAIYVIVFIEDSGQFLLIVSIALITVFFSIIGDLFESIIKRDANVKDSGQLLPGHGGMLDRIDSLTAAGPVFAVSMLLMSVVS